MFFFLIFALRISKESALLHLLVFLFYPCDKKSTDHTPLYRSCSLGFDRRQLVFVLPTLNPVPRTFHSREISDKGWLSGPTALMNLRISSSIKA
jgi:hypothetical protein